MPSEDAADVHRVHCRWSARAAGWSCRPGATVQLYLFSPDVIHAFYVPQFLFKRDVVPGELNQFDFKVNEADAGQTFRGQCAELCGVGHRIMLFEVHALTGADFDAWLADKIATANATPTPAPSQEPPASGEPPPSRRPGGPPATLDIAAQNIAFDTDDPDGAGGYPVPDRLQEQGPGHPAQRRDPQGFADRRRPSSPARSSPAWPTKVYDVPALAGRQLRIRLYRPSDA